MRNQYPRPLRAALRQAIEAACPTEDQCGADEQRCFAAYPIHEGASVDGRLDGIYANVEGLIDLVLDTLYSPHRHVYFSTGCAHGRHGYCDSTFGVVGSKQPAKCKHCPSRCVCDCHAPGDEPLPSIGLVGADLERLSACA